MKTKIGQRLKEARKAFNYTQEDLAWASKVTASTIAHIETCGREPSAATLCKFADALGVTTDYLLCREDSANLERWSVADLARMILIKAENETTETD